jgi:hypothetical protein
MKLNFRNRFLIGEALVGLIIVLQFTYIVYQMNSVHGKMLSGSAVESIFQNHFACKKVLLKRMCLEFMR